MSNTGENAPALITTREAARMLGVCRQTISNYIRRGVIKLARTGDVRAQYLYRSDVEAIGTSAKKIEEIKNSIREEETELRNRLRELREVKEKAMKDSPTWLRYDGKFLPIMRACIEFARFYTSERGYEFLIRYLVNGESLEEIGDSFCLTRERVRQIIEKNVKRMRMHAEDAYMIMEDYHEAKDDNNFLFEWAMAERKRNTDLRKENDLLRQGILAKEEADKRKPYAMSDAIPILDLCISVRTHNALKAAGIDQIGDLRGKTWMDLMKIRNLGKKSVREIIEKTRKYGLWEGGGNSRND